ncbi:MAG: type 1 glutamine amidotransferase [Thermoleophilaceae bacterium]|nr:type 1 glutamine amidotransferase [Thermoleophilaceae bacterium]
MSALDRPLRALVIEHERATPGGLLFQWLDELGADVDVHQIDVEQSDPDPREYGLLVSLGSEFPAYDDTLPWLGREMQMMRDAYAAEVPILGVCFGGQLLARVLGGDVYRSQQSEIGWLPVRSRKPDVVPHGPWFQWHFDVFEPPPGSTLLADSPVGPQAYTIGRSLGIQFHPEVTPEIMEEWVRVYRHELDAEGVDPDRLLEETYERAEASRAHAWRLLGAFLDRVARRQDEEEVAGGR